MSNKRKIRTTNQKTYRLIGCSRCGTVAVMTAEVEQTWNAVFRQGSVVGVLCSDCQTPEENAEAEINMATLDYGVDEQGRALARPKYVPA